MVSYKIRLWKQSMCSKCLESRKSKIVAKYNANSSTKAKTQLLLVQKKKIVECRVTF